MQGKLVMLEKNLGIKIVTMMTQTISITTPNPNPKSLQKGISTQKSLLNILIPNPKEEVTGKTQRGIPNKLTI